MLGVVLAITLAGCGALPDLSEGKEIGERYFDALNRSDEGALAALYSPEFFESTPREDWERARAKLRAELGDYKAHKFVHASGSRAAGAGKAGDYIVLYYEVTYSKRRAKEKITVYKPLGGGDALIVRQETSW